MWEDASMPSLPPLKTKALDSLEKKAWPYSWTDDRTGAHKALWSRSSAKKTAHPPPPPPLQTFMANSECL